ncbi:hypothetical protein ES703_69121 [subsurface metagenome]
MRITGKVADFVGIAGGVIELLHGLGGQEVVLLRPLEPTLCVEPAHFLHGRHLVHVIDILAVCYMRHEIADVLEAPVTHGADEVAGFVHTVAGGEDVFTRGRLLVTEERLTLHVIRYLYTRQGEHRRGEVNKRHQLVVDGGGHQHGEV